MSKGLLGIALAVFLVANHATRANHLPTNTTAIDSELLRPLRVESERIGSEGLCVLRLLGGGHEQAHLPPDDQN
jgi:hypothetical protein